MQWSQLGCGVVSLNDVLFRLCKVRVFRELSIWGRFAVRDLGVFSTRKCNTRFANLDRKLHVESCILTFSLDDYLAYTQYL